MSNFRILFIEDKKDPFFDLSSCLKNSGCKIIEDFYLSEKYESCKDIFQNKLLEDNLLKVTLENIEDAVLNIDNNGFIRYMNGAAEKIFGIKKEEAVLKQIDKIGFIWKASDGKDLVHPFVNKNKNKIVLKEYSLIKIETQEKNNIECSVNPFFDLSDKLSGYVYLIKDISKRKKNNTIKSRLASIVETSNDAIVGIDIEGRVKNWNKGAIEIFGYSFQEVKNKNISMFLPDDVPNMFPVIIQQIKEGKPLESYEGLRKRKNGEIIIVSVLPSPIMNEKNEVEGFSFIIRDITERKKMEKEIIEIGENQSRRIGQDLHDSLGQQLTGVMLNLKAFHNEIKQKLDKEEADQFIFIEQLIKDSINKTKTLAENLITINLQGEGIRRGIEDLANFAKNIYKKEVVLSIAEDFPKLSDITETQIYQITKEAINNSAKYSGSSKIFISLSIVQSEIILSVRDEGRGMSDDVQKGLGLNIMKYRAGIMNGSLHVHSKKNKGTLVLCRVPFFQQEDLK